MNTKSAKKAKIAIKAKTVENAKHANKAKMQRK